MALKWGFFSRNSLKALYSPIPFISKLLSFQSSKQKIAGLLISSLAVFIFFYSVVRFDYMQITQQMNYKSDDLDRVTASDYSV